MTAPIEVHVQTLSLYIVILLILWGPTMAAEEIWSQKWDQCL